MSKEKSPGGARDILTMRIPQELNLSTKYEAEKMGISQNALLMTLIQMGWKMYNADFYIKVKD